MDQDDDDKNTKNDVAPPHHHHRDPRLDLTLLPFHFDVIPPHVTSLKQCAQHQIQALLTKEADHPAQLTSTDEDCLDDGFVLCDLAVPCQKLRAWRHMFPRVEPFYALKCNPDPMVAAVLAQLGAGFDCASVAELELARESIRLVNQKKNAATTSSTRQPSSDDDNASRYYFKIVYANPQRAEKDLDTALTMFERSPPLTFDGPEELYKVHSAYQKQLERWKQEQQQQHRISQSNNNNNAQAQPPAAPPPPDLILRLLVPDQHSSVPLGEKFGAAASDVDALIELALVELQLPVVGVSFHCGSGNHDPASYTTAIRLAAAAMDQINNRRCASLPRAGGGGGGGGGCWLLDIGGGYPGIDGLWGDRGRFCGGAAAVTAFTTDYNSERDGDSGNVDNNDDDDAGAETTVRIAKAVTPLLDDLFPTIMPDVSSGTSPKCASNVQIISEPGRYFVEGAFALCSRIYRVRVEEERDDENDDDVEAVTKRHYYIAQGVQGVFKDCLLCSETFVPIPLSMKTQDMDGSKEQTSNNKLVASTVHGPSGEGYDIICRDYLLPVLEIGDWLIFDRLGAYTLSIAARNGRPPVRYVLGDSESIRRSPDKH